MTAVAARLRAWNKTLDDSVDVRALAVLRIAIGPVVLLHLRPFLTAARDGIIYSDRFTLPFWDWYPELPRTAYVILLWLIVATALMLSVGLFTRTMAWLTAGGVAYNVFLSQIHFRHNRAFLIILLIGLAVLRSGRTMSLDALRARRRGTPLDSRGGSRLALTVLRLEIAAVYMASGFSKLVDSDWWGGTVTRLRIERYRPRLAEVGIPDTIIDVLADPGFQAAAAKVLVLMELFIGLGLLVSRSRKAAIWVAIPFHISIQFSAAVQVFSLAALAALFVWVDRPAHQRVVHVGEKWIAPIRMLDWTGRFRLVPSTDPMMVEGDGLSRTGPTARWFVLSRLPLTFWLAAPVQLLRRSQERPPAPIGVPF